MHSARNRQLKTPQLLFLPNWTLRTLLPPPQLSLLTDPQPPNAVLQEIKTGSAVFVQVQNSSVDPRQKKSISEQGTFKGHFCDFDGANGPHSASASQLNGSQFHIPFSNIHTSCYSHSKLCLRKAFLRCKSPLVIL